MKATYHATHRGPGGIQHIELQGDLEVEGFSSSPVNVSHLEAKVQNLEELVRALQTQVESLLVQQALQASTSQTSSVVAVVKSEQQEPAAEIPVAEPVAEPIVVPTSTSSKKKSAAST